VKWCVKKMALFLTKDFHGTPGPNTILLSKMCPWCSFIDPRMEFLALQNCQDHVFMFF